ncbi:hypothetical protein ACQR1Y_12330 [Bradyrhizobium sp. HKCCYLRH3099]|uniref:hypothetical protein n=1 Tax=unclassified Bradyrhizobium TaxID=2631580 RepID=UPI003EBDF536
MKFCLRCDDTGFVCEAHPALPWIDSPRGCRCGAPGDPCPICQRALLAAERPVIDPAERAGAARCVSICARRTAS